MSGHSVQDPPTRLHIEVHGLHRPGTEARARLMERAVIALSGVYRAEVNGPLGRIAVWYDPQVTSRADLEAAVAEIEAELGLAGEELPPGSARHPGDPWQWGRHAARLGASLTGAAYALSAALLPVRAIPVIVPTVTALIGQIPVLRGLVDSLLGRRVAAALLQVGVKGGNTLAQQPVNLLFDSIEHWLALREARARYDIWREWEETLSHRQGGLWADPVPLPPPRPIVIPDGPVERAANLMGLLGLGSAAVLATLGACPQRTLGALRAGGNRAAWTGRGSFAAQLGASLAGRGVLALDPAALRRLDRVSCVVIDTGVLVTAGTDTGSEVDPLAQALIDAACHAGPILLSGVPAGSLRGLGELPILDGAPLDRSIRELQEQGHVVLISATARAALAAADVGIGITGRVATIPWEADLLTGPDLTGACAVLRSVPLAHTVSRRSAQLALGGLALGNVLSGTGPAVGAARRAAPALHGVTLLSLAVATWYALAARRIPAPVPQRRLAWHARPAVTVLDELGSRHRGSIPRRQRDATVRAPPIRPNRKPVSAVRCSTSWPIRSPPRSLPARGYQPRSERSSTPY